MNSCLCGKTFDNAISCSRHKATCIVYRNRPREPVKEFQQEGVDHVVCAYCGHKARDLTRHLKAMPPPHPNPSEYKERFPGVSIVCSDVDLKRRATTMALHGSETYRNKIMQSAGVRRALRNDPDIIRRVGRTKAERYGDSGYVNSEKRRNTMLKRYGVDNPMKNPASVMKALKTKKILYEDNPTQRPPVLEKSVLENRHHVLGKTLHEIGDEFHVSEAVVSYWMKKHGIQVKRKIVIPKTKEFIRPEVTVREYLEHCAKLGTYIGFLLYGTQTEACKAQRLKRLFNKGRVYHALLSELKTVAGHVDRIDEFLKKLLHFKG